VVEQIDSIDDPRLGDYRHVADPSWLRAHGLFVAEGRLVVERLLDRDGFRIKSILLTPAASAAMPQVTRAAQVYVAPQGVVNEVTGFNFHRGCLAIVHRPAEAALEDFMARRRLLALEGVGNPDNVGGLFRVAAAFGVDGVLLDMASGDPFYRKAIRTSMGATLSLPFARDASWPAGLDALRSAGYRILALTPRSDATPIRSIPRSPGDRFVLLAGAEGPGLTDAAMARADVQVRIPIVQAVDSLNVTVAAGIALAFLTP
jgi:tRNA G18 (ribose-2'-O)-methylase SpoU